MNRFAISSIRVTLAGCLLVSSWFHLSNQYFFVADIHNYRLTPTFASILLASSLPYFQICLAAALVVPLCSNIAAFFCSLLFLTYFSAQLIAMLQGINIDCGCFGGSSQPISLWTMGLAALLSGLSFIVYRNGASTETEGNREAPNACQ